MSADQDEAFVEFVRSSSPALLKTAWFICGDPHQAEELVQAALEKVYVRWHRVDAGQALAYTRRVLLNQHIDTGRRRRRETLVASPPEQPGARETVQDTAYLVQSLATLTRRERQVVVLRYYTDLSEVHVADLLGISVGTVKSTASQGLAKLRRLLVAEGGTHG